MCFQEMKSSWRSLVGGGIGIVRPCFSYHRADPSCIFGVAVLEATQIGENPKHIFRTTDNIHPSHLCYNK